MKYTEPCPDCNTNDSHFKGYNENKTRRRKCNKCGYRWTIKEESQKIMLKGDLSFDDREVANFSLNDFWDKAKADQAFNQKLNYKQKSLHATIKTDKPIILQFIADMQFGGAYVDYELFEKYTDYIINTPDLYLAILGDELDSFLAGFFSAQPVHSQLFNPEQQQMFFGKWLESIEHKLMFSTWDNHSDMRYEKVLGWSPAAMLRAKYAPYFDGHSQIYLRVGKTEYKISAAHHFKAKSKFNPLHGAQSFARETVQDSDIYVGADQHQASIGHMALGGKDRIYIMTGSLQGSDKTGMDDYTNRFFTPFSQKEMPCIVLHPDKREMSVHRTMESGAAQLRGWK